jgi:predicted nucleotidyltransferase
MEQALTREQVIKILKKELPYLKDKYGVGKIAIFGSFAKGENSPHPPPRHCKDL